MMEDFDRYARVNADSLSIVARAAATDLETAGIPATYLRLVETTYRDLATRPATAGESSNDKTGN